MVGKELAIDKELEELSAANPMAEMKGEMTGEIKEEMKEGEAKVEPLQISWAESRVRPTEVELGTTEIAENL